MRHRWGRRPSAAPTSPPPARLQRRLPLCLRLRLLQQRLPVLVLPEQAHIRQQADDRAGHTAAL